MLVAVALGAAPVLADGDPASDVLLNQDVFYPYSPPVAPALQSILNGETAAASRAGAPVKVALIASPVDLGTVPNLFGKPQPYAHFLEQEIVLAQNQQTPLLVVMAAGYGLEGVGSGATSAIAGLHKPAGSQSADLARAAMTAVAKIAAASGHPIPTPSAANTSVAGESGTSAGGKSGTPIPVVAAAAAVVAIAGLLVTRRLRRARS